MEEVSEMPRSQNGSLFTAGEALTELANRAPQIVLREDGIPRRPGEMGRRLVDETVVVCGIDPEVLRPGVIGVRSVQYLGRMVHGMMPSIAE
ncbi:MAG: hypothetical protein NW215_00630 [Hyphomicrobiales bacterium]|nr:hypothetical protein [Hyphomicrobiales bacterium]